MTTDVEAMTGMKLACNPTLHSLYSSGSGEKYQVSISYRPNSMSSTFLTLVNSSCSLSWLASNMLWSSSSCSSSCLLFNLRVLEGMQYCTKCGMTFGRGRASEWGPSSKMSQKPVSNFAPKTSAAKQWPLFALGGWQAFLWNSLNNNQQTAVAYFPFASSMVSGSSTDVRSILSRLTQSSIRLLTAGKVAFFKRILKHLTRAIKCT